MSSFVTEKHKKIKRAQHNRLIFSWDLWWHSSWDLWPRDGTGGVAERGLSTLTAVARGYYMACYILERRQDHAVLAVVRMVSVAAAGMAK